MLTRRNDLLPNLSYKLWPIFVLIIVLCFILLVEKNWFTNAIISVLLTYLGFIAYERYFKE